MSNEIESSENAPGALSRRQFLDVLSKSVIATSAFCLVAMTDSRAGATPAANCPPGGGKGGPSPTGHQGGPPPPHGGGHGPGPNPYAPYCPPNPYAPYHPGNPYKPYNPSNPYKVY